MRSIFGAVCFSIALLPGVARANEGVATIRLDAQLWTRPLGAESRLKFRPLGRGLPLEAILRPSARAATYRTAIETAEVRATVTFILVPPTAREPAYLVTQMRVFNNGADRGLIAECANYDGIAGERVLGAGVCSGVIGDAQFGLTLSKPAR